MNLEIIKEELLKKQLKSAAVDILVYPNKDFVIIPRGRSVDNKWIGAKVLNYKEKGNLNKDDEKTFADKIVGCLNVCHDYEKMGVEPTNKDVEPNFNIEGCKNSFKDYHYLSLILFSNTDIIKINSLRPIDKKGSEWVGKSDDAVELTLSDANKIYDNIKKYTNTQCR